MAITLSSSYQLICSKSTSTYSTLRVYGKVNSQNTANNTSSVSIQARLYGNGGSGSFSSGSTATTLNGSTQNQTLGNTSYSKGSEKTLSTKTYTITHNADGTYTNKAVSVKLTSSSTPSGTASGTINVATIPRASQPSANPNLVDINGSTTISTNRASSSFTHTISYSFGALSGNVGTGIGDSIYWTIPNTFIGQFSSTERQKSCTLTCITYSGSTNIGTKTTTITINIPDSSRPTYTTPTKSETDASVISAIGSSMNKAIINLSKPRYQMTLASHDGANLKSVQIKCGDISNTINLSGTSYNLDYTFANPMTSNVVQIIITDSRGLQTTYTDTYNNYEIYTKPTITYQKISRSGLAGDVRIQLNGSLQATNIGGGTTNNISSSFRYKENASGSTWSSSTDLTSLISYNSAHNEWYLDTTRTGLVPYDKSYIIEITLADSSTPTTPIVRTYTINKAVPTMSLGENDMQVNGEVVVDSIRSKNMFDKNANIKIGYINSSGNVVTSDTTLSYQDNFIMVNPYTTYTISSSVSTIFRICEYTLSKTFIERKLNTVPNISFTFTTGANTYYLKMGGVYTTSILTLQLEKGSIATTYAPYQNLDGYDNYSTSEQVIGTWINGKTLYRKVIILGSITINSVANQTLESLNITNVSDIFVNVSKSFVKNTSNEIRPLPGAINTSNINYVYCTNTRLYRYCTSNDLNGTWNICLEYTKSTD